MNRPGRFWLIAPWTAFALLAVGWVAYWHVVANAAEDRVQQWVLAQNAAGASATYERIYRRGFPVMLRLEIRGPAYEQARGGWRAETDQATLHVNLLNTAHVGIEADAPITITREGGAQTVLSADAMIASVRMNGASLAQAGVEADALVLDDPAREGVLRIEKLVLNTRPDPRTAGDYQVVLEASGLTLPRPVRSFEAFGQEIASLRAAAAVRRAASLLDSAEDDPLTPWREAGGRVQFDAVEMSWGPLTATGRGEGGLDEARRLEGRLDFDIPEPAPAFAALALSETVSGDARNALRALSIGYQVSGDAIVFDVEARGGALYLEGLRARDLPPVY